MVSRKFHYRWDFIGLSTDEKPTPETSEKVVNGSTFYCSDTSKLYVFYEGTWYERKALGGGGGGGTDDYDDLSNKPKINGVELTGNKTSADLNIEGGKFFLATRNVTTYADLLEANKNGQTIVVIGNSGSTIYEEAIHISVDESATTMYITTVYLNYSNSRSFIKGYKVTASQATWQQNSIEVATSAALTTGLAAKQDTLVSGTNIKTVANQSLLGSGDVEFKTINNSSISGSGNLNTGKVAADVQTNSVSIYEGTDNSVQISKDSNDTLRIQGYGEDDRGQTQTLYDMSLPAVSYFNGKLGTNLAVGQETWYGTYTDENNVTYQVYTKTIYIPALPATAGITTYDHGVSNIKQILSIYGFTADGFVLNAPRQNAVDNISIYQASKSASNQTFSIEVGKDRSNKSAYVTMVYAKNN